MIIWVYEVINDSYLVFANNFINYLVTIFFPMFYELIIAPLIYPEILWIFIPLFISTFLMILYFGRHRGEELGWNTAFGNNISLMFVSINLLKKLYDTYGYDVFNLFIQHSPKIYFIYFILFYTFLQLVINYFHLVPKEVSFKMNSSVPVFLLNYFAIIMAYTNIPFSITSILSALLIFFIIQLIVRLMWGFVPMSKRARRIMGIRHRKEEKEEEIEEKVEEIDENIMSEKYEFIVLGIILLLLTILITFLVNFYYSIEDYYSIIISGFIIIFLATLVFLKKLKPENFLLYFNIKNMIKGIPYGILIFFYYLITSSFIAGFFKTGLSVFRSTPLMIFSIIISGISYEIFFRGFLQRGFKIKHNILKSIIFQSVFFMLGKSEILFLDNNPLLLFNIILLLPVGILHGYLKEKHTLDACMGSIMTLISLSIYSLFL